MIAGSSVPATPATTAPATPALATLPLTEIGASVGTPCYVYHAPTMRAAYQSLDAALGDYPHAVHYALKANSSLEIVRLLTALGASVDANSMGEVDIALRCGVHPSQIMFTGVGKSVDELSRAIALGLKAINVESPGELDRLLRQKPCSGRRRRAWLAGTPDRAFEAREFYDAWVLPVAGSSSAPGMLVSIAKTATSLGASFESLTGSRSSR